MKVVVDANILARTLIAPKIPADNEQRAIAENLLKKFDEVIIPTHVFCELAWVLFGQGIKKEQIHFAFQHLMKTSKIVCKEDKINAGLQMLEKGGDFADGVNEYTGRVMAHGLSSSHRSTNRR
jgi:predicted nucleic-acid-binding protein